MRIPSISSFVSTGRGRGGAALLVVAVIAGVLWLGGAGAPREAFAFPVPAPLSSPIDQPNDPPLIDKLDGDVLFYTAGTGPMVLDQAPDASVTDPDSPRFDEGSLTVRIVTGGAPGEDVLGLAAVGGINLSAGTEVGSVVSIYDTAIGTVTANGRNGANLAISLGTFANPTAATLLVQATTYNNPRLTPTEGGRTLRFTVNDGAGGTDGATVTVAVTGPEGVQSVYLPLVLNAH